MPYKESYKYKLPEGFVSIALEAVRESLMYDRMHGNHLDNLYYIQIARCVVARAFINWKNEECHTDTDLRTKDLAYQLSKQRVPFVTNHGGIDFSVGGLRYTYTGYVLLLRYQNGRSDINHPEISAKNLVKLLFGIADAVPAIDRHVLKKIDAYHREFKSQQLMHSTLEKILEPGLEDIEYQYRCKSEGADMALEIWIYYTHVKEHHDCVVRLPLTVSAFLGNIEGYRNMIRRIAEDFEKFSLYPHTVQVLDITDERVPGYDSSYFSGKHLYWWQNKK